MDYLIKQEDILDLKVEDNSDQYLFNSLLEIGELQQPEAPLQQLQPYSFLDNSHPNYQKTNQQVYEESIIHELSHLYNLRTTPLPDLMAYVDQAFEPSEALRKSLYLSLKRFKMQLKRENAKKRSPQIERHEEIIEEVKIQDNALSSFAFDDQSQETKKKKRNRMSAQKSRDRKKEYIKQIQKLNKELKKKMEENNTKSKPKVKPVSRDFLKVLLCLGITCFLNTTPHSAPVSQQLVEEERPSTETISTFETGWMPTKIEPKLDLEECKKLLPLSQQKMLEEALSGMGQTVEVINIESQQNLQEETERSPTYPILQQKGRPRKFMGQKTQSDCSTP